MKNETCYIILLVPLVVFLMLLSGCGTMYSLDESEEDAVASILEYQQKLKDPDSMILSGDVIVHMAYGNGETVTCFKANGKNAFGAYAGAVEVEVFSRDGVPIWFSAEGSDYFLNLRENYFKSREFFKSRYSVQELDAVRLAHYIGCKYN